MPEAAPEDKMGPLVLKDTMLIQKQYARRDISGFRSPHSDPFAYSSLADLGQAAFVDALRRVCAQSAGIDVLGYLRNPDREFNDLIELAGSTFNSEQWFLASLDGVPAGMVLPQRFYDLPEEGTLFHIGVVLELRGRGYGKILHAKGLELLALSGVSKYVGSTHVDNQPMIRVFKSNGCLLTAIREQEIPDYRL